MIVPILHAGRFTWDEAIVLVVAILVVPVLSWFTGRIGQRMQDASPREERRARRRAGLRDGDDGGLSER